MSQSNIPFCYYFYFSQSSSYYFSYWLSPSSFYFYESSLPIINTMSSNCYNIKQMTQLGERIQKIAETIQNGTIKDLQLGLKQVASIPKQQLAANQTAISYPVQQLVESVQRNVKLNQNDVQSGSQIQRLVQRAADNLPNQIKRQITGVVKNIDKQAREAEQATRIDRQVRRETQNIQKRLQRGAIKQNDLPNVRISNLKPIGSSLSPIQQSVQSFLPVLGLEIPKVTKPDQLPETMKLLSRYAAIKGRIPVGSITNKPGSAYVGLRRVDRGDGVTEIVQYEKNEILKSQVPSIPMQLQYYANKTINSWNNYVTDESRFVNFFSKINTAQSRLKYVEQSFKTMNMQTYSAQLVASINFYYLFLPMQKMAQMIGYGHASDFTEDNFINQYQVGDTPKTNPLLLSSQNASKLAKELFRSETPTVFVQNIVKIIQGFSNQLNKKQISKLREYVEGKMTQARQFLLNNGLAKQLADSVLMNPDWSSVKKRKLLLNSAFINSQLVQLAQNIVQDTKKNQTIQQIVQSWGSPQIICHDYIWGWSSG